MAGLTPGNAARPRAGSGGCGTGSGGFRPGNTCGRKGGGNRAHSIPDPPDRHPAVIARDALSAAKLAHAAARKSGDAGKVAGARSALHAARESYRAASGGTIHGTHPVHGHPLDHADPRVAAIRSGRSPLQFGRESDPALARTRGGREDRVLMRIGSPVAGSIAHHPGEPAPRPVKADAEGLKRVRKAEARGKAPDPADAAHQARLADREASEAGRSGNRAYLIHDRLTGQHRAETDAGLRISPLRHESFRSGRFDVLKAYGANESEVPVDHAVLAHLKGGEGATRSSNVARHIGSLHPDDREAARARVAAGRPLHR